METTAAQINNAPNVSAIGAENAINGNYRHLPAPVVPDFVGNTLTLNLTARTGIKGFTIPLTVSATFTNGNVTNVSGNIKPPPIQNLFTMPFK